MPAPHMDFVYQGPFYPMEGAKTVPATKWDCQRACSPFAIAYCEFRWFFSFSLQREMRFGQQIVGAGAFEIQSSKGIRVARWLGRSGRPAITPDLLIDPEYPEVATDIMAKLREATEVVSLGPSRVAGGLGASFERQDKKVFAEKTTVAWIVALLALKIEKLRKKNKT